MKKENWIWMPHAAHFILGDKCQFHLATYVGKYIVSTVGELWSEQAVRRIHAEVHDPKWYADNKELLGDYFDREYMKKFGFDDIGYERKFETMVFKAVRFNVRNKTEKDICCPYVIESGDNLDADSYNKTSKAYEGHMAMCRKWGKV